MDEFIPKLRDLLASAYTDPKDAARVASDAGLNPALLQLDGKPINNWQNILDCARDEGRLQKLLNIVKGEKPALPELDEIIKLLPPGPTPPLSPTEVAMKAATSAMEEKRWQLARELWKKVRELAPDNLEAQKHLENFDSLDATFQKGLYHYKDQQWQEAYECFEQVHENTKNYRGAYSRMATTRLKLERPEFASVSVGETLRESPDLDLHFQTVVNAFKSGGIVPFLGLNINLSSRPSGTAWKFRENLPSYNDLTSYLSTAFPFPKEEYQTITRVAEYITLTRGTSELFTTLQSIYKVNYPPTPLHQFAASIPSLFRGNDAQDRQQIVISTNYDDVLERTLKELGEPFELLVYMARGKNAGKFQHLSFDGTSQKEIDIIDKPNEYEGLLDKSPPILVKMHGTINQPASKDSFVIAENHFLDYFAQGDIVKIIPKTLHDELLDRQFLFMGQDLSSWNVRRVIKKLWGNQERQDTSWAIQPNPTPFERVFWEDLGVKIIDRDLDWYLVTLLEYLQN